MSGYSFGGQDLTAAILSHNPAVSSKFAHLYDNEYLSDFTFHFQESGTTLRAHRMIVAVSVVLDNHIAKGENIYVVTDDEKLFRILIRGMYVPVVETPKERI